MQIAVIKYTNFEFSFYFATIKHNLFSIDRDMFDRSFYVATYTLFSLQVAPYLLVLFSTCC